MQTITPELPKYLRELTWNCKVARTKYGWGLISNGDSTALVVPKKFVLDRRAVINYIREGVYSIEKPDCSKPPQHQFESILLKHMLAADPYGQADPQEVPARVLLLHFLLLTMLQIRRGSTTSSGGDQKFAVWVKSLPPSKEINAPYSWPEEEIDDKLKGTSIYDACRGKHATLARRYQEWSSDKKLTKLIAEYVLSGPGMVKNTKDILKYSMDLLVSFDDWLLAEQWISSRTLGGGNSISGTAVSDSSGDIIMVPGIDLANHDYHMNSGYDFGEDGSVTLYTKAKDGEEITINYGANKGAGEYLFNYGFIPADLEVSPSCTYHYDLRDPDVLKAFGVELSNKKPSDKKKNGDDDEEMEDQDVSYELLLKFLDRPINTIQYHSGHSLVHDEFLYLLASLAFLELVMVGGYYELHMVGREVDLEHTERFVKSCTSVFADQIAPEIKRLSSGLAKLFRGKLNENTSGHRLVELEAKLLDEFIQKE